MIKNPIINKKFRTRKDAEFYQKHFTFKADNKGILEFNDANGDLFYRCGSLE